MRQVATMEVRTGILFYLLQMILSTATNFHCILIITSSGKYPANWLMNHCTSYSSQTLVPVQALLFPPEHFLTSRDPTEISMAVRLPAGVLCRPRKQLLIFSIADKIQCA